MRNKQIERLGMNFQKFINCLIANPRIEQNDITDGPGSTESGLILHPGG